MTHPDLDRLTAWVHELLPPPEAGELEGHAASCPDCRALAGRVRAEARVVAGALAPSPGLQARLLGEARPRRGLLWQVPLAAAVLAGLLGILLWPGPRHELVAGRLALEDGREVAAPVGFAASKPWRLLALDRASVRLSDRTAVELAPGSRMGLEPRGERGVQPDLASGEAAFAVAPDARRLVVCSPAGRVEAADGKYTLKVVFSQEGGTPMLAGALVTVFAGSLSLSNAHGTAQAAPGQAAVMTLSEAPLFTAAPGEKQEDLLRRLEQLAAAIARLEAEISKLEERNRQLKAQLSSNAPGGAVWFGGGGQGGLRVVAPEGAQVEGVLLERKKEK